jgi:enoyl-CoA hydratase/carnithine racemase
MADGSENVRTDIETLDSGGKVARVIVSRPGKLNTLTPGHIEALRDAFADLANDDDLRVVVLTGEGERAFIGGADLDTLGALTPDTARAFITSLHEVCAAIRALPVPVIARIQGYCLGAGLEVAASCDMRVAADDAVFGMPEVKVGLPSVIEAALLPRLVGWGKTREIVYTGENFGAEEALRIGLVEKLAPLGQLDDAVERWVTSICTAGPNSIRSQKALIREWEALPLDQAIDAGISALSDAYRTDEPARLVQAFFERKAAAKKP